MTTDTRHFEATGVRRHARPHADHAVAAGNGIETGVGTISGGTRLLGLFAIPLGLAGLGSTWWAARTTLSAPAWPAEVLYAASLAGWVVLTIAYLVGGIREPSSFAADRQHAIYGPFAAYIPVIAILLAAHYEQHAHRVGQFAVTVFVVALVVVAAQLLAHWLRGNLPIETFHPGYLLPTVAGAFIASIGLSACGWHRAAAGAFGVGVFFWLSIGTLVFNRLFTCHPLPDPIKPSLSVLVSPPATAGLAWLALEGGRIDPVGYALLSIMFVLLFVQVLFFSEYRRLTFTPNFWTFTFPISASTTMVVRWLNIEMFPFWRAWSWTLAGIATAAVLAFAVANVTYLLQRRRRRRPVRAMRDVPGVPRARSMPKSADRQRRDTTRVAQPNTER
jgi:tellurite resistance protein